MSRSCTRCMQPCNGVKAEECPRRIDTVAGRCRIAAGSRRAGAVVMLSAVISPAVAGALLLVAGLVMTGQPAAAVDGAARVALGRCFTEENILGVCRRIQDVQGGYSSVANALTQPCTGSCFGKGVCCPLQGQRRAQARKNSSLLVMSVKTPLVTVEVSHGELETAARFVAVERRRNRITGSPFHAEAMVERGGAAFRHRRLQRPTKNTLRKLALAETGLQASKKVARDRLLSPLQSVAGLIHTSLRNSSLEETCEVEPLCKDSPFRRIDGRCNNLQHGLWGASDTQYERISLPAYADGLTEPRRASDGKNLPSARIVSVIVSPTDQEEHSTLSLMVMQWGQFLDHDMTHTPMIETPDGGKLRCCRYGFRLPPHKLNAECFPIEMPPQDPLYRHYGERCMEFVRSVYAPRRDCSLGPREQINQITAYIDASNVYGSLREDDEDYEELRQFEGGLLRHQMVNQHPLLPQNPFECHKARQPNQTCFYAGDERVNEQMNLAVLHTLWMREHNRVAEGLARVNPGWKDVRLYEEARRIVAALMQHITYSEFLPIILGESHINETGVLRPRTDGFTYFYDPEISAAITNEFATAAYRFGHTLIPDHVVMMPQFGKAKKKMPLHLVQSAPFELYKKNGFRELLRGLLEMPIMTYDNAFSAEIVGKLFQFEGIFGMDLVALNIQRGRDHGIPGYNDIREVCKLSRAKTWSDLHSYMDKNTVERLAVAYTSVDDIDLYIGGVSERSVDDALVGPTFRCVLADQFIKLRLGDRYFYEEGGQTGSFSLAQLNEIRKVRLSKVICSNDNMGWVQPDVFRKPNSKQNRRTGCADPSMLMNFDFSHWKE